MTASEFRNELKHLSGGYLFCGEEDYLMRHYLAAARDSVVAKDDIFNRIIITSDNYSPDVLMSALESLPVMSDRKFIEISGLPLGDMKEQDTDDLCDILSRLPEYEYNILIIYADADNFDTVKAVQKASAGGKTGDVSEGDSGKACVMDGKTLCRGTDSRASGCREPAYLKVRMRYVGACLRDRQADILSEICGKGKADRGGR